MTFSRIALAAACALALGACTDLRGGLGGGDGAGAGAGAGALGAGAANPSSPAYFTQTVGDRVYFAVDQATLTPEAMATLDAQADWLNQNTIYNVVIEGHADEQGTREYNLALGARRANAVRDYLVSRGVAPHRIQIVTYGKERPVAICSDEACYSKNRRAVTVVTAGAGA